MGDAAEIRVRVQPGASRNEIGGEHDGALVIRLTASPVEGRANKALQGLIAKRARVARGRVSITRGAKSRDKVVRVEGLSEAQLHSALRQ